MPMIESLSPSTAADVRTALDRAGYSELKRLDVTVQNGAVWIRGRVTSFFLKQIAQQCAQTVPGVTRVNNEVTVGGQAH